MSQNVNNEIEVEEVFSQDYLDFLDSLEIVPVIFDANDIIEDFASNPYQENWWDEDITYCNPEESYIDQINEENDIQAKLEKDSEDEYVDFSSLIENDDSYNEEFYLDKDKFNKIDKKNIVSFKEKLDTLVYTHNYNFPQPEPKYFKVSPFELIPKKKYLTF